MLVFVKGGKPENQEKNPWSKDENHQLTPHMTLSPGIEPGFCINMLCDWFTQLVPLSQPMSIQTKTNHVFVTRIFPI